MAIVAIIDTGYASYDYEKELFPGMGYELQIFPGERVDVPAKQALAMKAEGILVRDTPIGEEVFAKAPDLKFIVRYGTGYDNIDVEAATARGIKVANVGGYGNHSVSDHALALMFACIRGIPTGEKNVMTSFGKPPFSEVFEMHDKTLGIIGLGRIGGTLSDKARHLFSRVLATDPYIPDEKFSQHGAEKSDLENLLQKSHVISLHCNLTEETRHLLDNEAFSMMGQCPVVVNTSRGPVIDANALLEAADEMRIHSAGIDVYENEPADQRQEGLVSHPRIITTGHYAWYSDRAIKIMQKSAADNLAGMLRGELIEDCLNP
jgi:D-3-phosphoglycerate dehydrogenase